MLIGNFADYRLYICNGRVNLTCWAKSSKLIDRDSATSCALQQSKLYESRHRLHVAFCFPCLLSSLNSMSNLLFSSSTLFLLDSGSWHLLHSASCFSDLVRICEASASIAPLLDPWSHFTILPPLNKAPQRNFARGISAVNSDLLALDETYPTYCTCHPPSKYWGSSSSGIPNISTFSFSSPIRSTILMPVAFMVSVDCHWLNTHSGGSS